MPRCRIQSCNFRQAFTLLELIITLAVIGLVVALLLPATRTAREPARRVQCRNNLKQIGLALSNYHDRWNAFPPAYTVDADGKPLHSWRTLLLPYMDQAALYSHLDLSKPWDDPLNTAVFRSAVVPAYRCPSNTAGEDHTGYVAVVSDHSAFRGTSSTAISDFKDGTSNSLHVIEVDAVHSVPWMSPRDADESITLSFRDPKNKDSHTGGVHALFADGAVRFLSENIEVNKARALLTIDGGETVGDF